MMRPPRITASCRSFCDVARWTAQGIEVPTCLVEAAAWHKAVRPVCRCGHAASFNPHGLWWHFTKRGWNEHLSQASKRFWCLICRYRTGTKVKPARIDLVAEADSDTQLPLPPREIWRKQVQRMR